MKIEEYLNKKVLFKIINKKAIVKRHSVLNCLIRFEYEDGEISNYFHFDSDWMRECVVLLENEPKKIKEYGIVKFMKEKYV